MPNKRYNDQVTGGDNSGGGTPPAKRGVAQKSLPEEKAQKRLGGKPYGVRGTHTADMPHVKHYVAGDY